MSEQGGYPGSYPGPEQGPGQPQQPQQPPVYPQAPSYPPAQPGYYYGTPPAPGFAPAGGRPGKLTAAAVITWIGAGLVGLMSVLVLIGGLVLPEAELLEYQDEFDQAGLTIDDLKAIIVVMGVVGIVWCGGACISAGLMLKRQNWARVLLAVSSAATILFSLLAITAVIPLVFTGAAIAVLVMIFSSESNAWFRGEQYGGPPMPPYGGQPNYGQQAPPPPYPPAGGPNGPW